MKKLIISVLTFAMAVLPTIGLVNGEEKAEKNEIVSTEKNDGYKTEKFIVENKTSDGMLDARSLDEDTSAPNGYLLDDKYEVGDIVEVTFKNDEIKKEKKLNE